MESVYRIMVKLDEVAGDIRNFIERDPEGGETGTGSDQTGT